MSEMSAYPNSIQPFFYRLLVLVLGHSLCLFPWGHEIVTSCQIFSEAAVALFWLGLVWWVQAYVWVCVCVCVRWIKPLDCGLNFCSMCQRISFVCPLDLLAVSISLPCQKWYNDSSFHPVHFSFCSYKTKPCAVMFTVLHYYSGLQFTTAPPCNWLTLQAVIQCIFSGKWRLGASRVLNKPPFWSENCFPL